MADPAAVLVAARDEAGTIAKTVAALRQQFPAAEVIVADDGSRDGTAAEAERAGARVVKLPRRGKGQALTLGEQAAPAGALVLADADLVGDLGPLARNGDDLTIAAFAERRGGGLGIAKTMARTLIRARSAFEAREPLSGQRHLSAAARAETFPVAAGFGCEVRMTIDAARAGLRVSELVLPLTHRRPGATSAASRIEAASSSTRFWLQGRSPSTTEGCACRSSGGRSGSAAIQQSPRSPRSVSPTTSGRAPSEASGDICARATRPASSSSSASRSPACSPRARSRAHSSLGSAPTS